MTTKSYFNGIFSSIFKPSKDAEGFIPLSSFVTASPKFNDYGEQIKKIQAVLTNPALLKVFSLQCDTFSLGKFYAEKDGVEIDNLSLVTLLNKPNPLQSRSQFLWDFMFWTMIGTSYCYIDSSILDNADNKLYFIDPSKIEWPDNLIKSKDKFIFSKQAKADILKSNITYKFEDGTKNQFPLSQIIITTDLSNGTGNWFKGGSRIDALYKVISNSEAALDANNINTRYSGKFIVSGTQDPKDTTRIPLSNEDALDMETKINGRKQVHAYKSMIEIKRFVENLKNLDLGKQYLDSYFLIGSMYNIPRDVLEANVSSTYENQEKAMAKHISYTLQPKGNDLTEALSNYFKLQDGIKLKMKWDHLPFMQVFEKEKAVTRQILTQSFISLQKSGLKIDEINNFLGTNFSEPKQIAIV